MVSSVENIDTSAKVDSSIHGTEDPPTISSKTNFDNEIPRSGLEWSEYFKQKYGPDNVDWVSNVENIDTSIKSGRYSEDIIQYEKLKSQYIADEIYNAERIGSALNDDSFHRAASYLPKEQLANGRTYSYTGGDNKSYTLLQTKGQLDGVDGIFEYITNDVGQVTHQRFIKGGIYTGFPNQVVPKGGYK